MDLGTAAVNFPGYRYIAMLKWYLGHNLVVNGYALSLHHIKTVLSPSRMRGNCPVLARLSPLL